MDVAGGGSHVEFVAVESPLAMIDRRHGCLSDKGVEENSRFERREREMKEESSVWLNTPCSKCDQRTRSPSKNMGLLPPWIVDAVYNCRFSTYVIRHNV